MWLYSNELLNKSLLNYNLMGVTTAVQSQAFKLHYIYCKAVAAQASYPPPWWLLAFTSNHAYTKKACTMYIVKRTVDFE